MFQRQLIVLVQPSGAVQLFQLIIRREDELKVLIDRFEDLSACSTSRRKLHELGRQLHIFVLSNYANLNFRLQKMPDVSIEPLSPGVSPTCIHADGLGIAMGLSNGSVRVVCFHYWLFGSKEWLQQPQNITYSLEDAGGGGVTSVRIHNFLIAAGAKNGVNDY
ncbi:unnamed protein product [Protopolystoma xenopodis]|uniref:Uncharacterized protein n=1 Tax=Protopolystoma xenopodis TaxID=117903 RepID=A0A3S5CQ77_9PLAT|nr:unnamed protein product [Protopolystoma xenopodis]